MRIFLYIFVDVISS